MLAKEAWVHDPDRIEQVVTNGIGFTTKVRTFHQYDYDNPKSPLAPQRHLGFLKRNTPRFTDDEQLTLEELQQMDQVLYSTGINDLVTFGSAKNRWRRIQQALEVFELSNPALRARRERINRLDPWDDFEF